MATKSKSGSTGAAVAAGAASTAFVGTPAGLTIALGKLAYDYFSSSDELDSVPDSELHGVAARKRLDAEIAQQNAKTAIEISIAQRILTATEVEIEEFYEGSGEGGLGLNVDAKSKAGHLGAHGRGSKVTRRIVRLSGWVDGGDTEALARLTSDE